MPNDFEMMKLVQANHVAQTIFLRIVFKIFRKIACGFSSSNQYSQDVDANRKSIGFFGLVNFVASAKVYMKQLAFLDSRGVLFAIDDDVKILAPPAVIGKIARRTYRTVLRFSSRRTYVLVIVKSQINVRQMKPTMVRNEPVLAY